MNKDAELMNEIGIEEFCDRYSYAKELLLDLYVHPEWENNPFISDFFISSEKDLRRVFDLRRRFRIPSSSEAEAYNHLVALAAIANYFLYVWENNPNIVEDPITSGNRNLNIKLLSNVKLEEDDDLIKSVHFVLMFKVGCKLFDISPELEFYFSHQYEKYQDTLLTPNDIDPDNMLILCGVRSFYETTKSDYYGPIKTTLAKINKKFIIDYAIKNVEKRKMMALYK